MAAKKKQQPVQVCNLRCQYDWEGMEKRLTQIESELKSMNSVVNNIVLNGDNVGVSLQTALRQIYDLVKPQQISRDFWTVFRKWREGSVFFRFLATKAGKIIFIVFGLWIVLSMLNDLGVLGPPFQIIGQWLKWIFKFS